jgi:hypothetical protein
MLDWVGSGQVRIDLVMRTRRGSWAMASSSHLAISNNHHVVFFLCRKIESLGLE